MRMLAPAFLLAVAQDPPPEIPPALRSPQRPPGPQLPEIYQVDNPEIPQPINPAPATVAAADPKQLPEPRTRIRIPQHSPRARAGIQEGTQSSRATQAPPEIPPALRAPQRIHPATVAAADPKQLPEIRTRIRIPQRPPGPQLPPEILRQHSPEAAAAAVTEEVI